MITGVDLFEFSVRDAAKTIAFYKDVLGMRPTEETEQGAEFTLGDGTTFGIWQPDDEQYPIGAGIMFAVPDAKAAVEQLRARGAQLSDVMESRVCFMSFGTDPEGNRFMIHQRKA
ncbi:MAG: VOC family protein [Candidatus Eremiobacteraeota bacterium]|nr:VOC family protein [Candidatus Eremiobacteraeota bacterium]